ncbi:RHS repeat-associated core domain-containing protein [Xanthomonas sp. WHRI 1810A]|uniref:RHS repeat-associated core domain-containing protein n=1 Tax=Xanthomonas sp. WHRI 1810A TaxID=3161565 RepID=UPI0032E8A72F
MSVHHHTPLLRGLDPRGLLVRDIAYCRTNEEQTAQERITRHAWDAAGHDVADCDPRLWANGLETNTTTLYSLSGKPLLESGTDAGWRLSLTGADHQSMTRWDGRGSCSRTDYDFFLRPAQIAEGMNPSAMSVVERFLYGDASNDLTPHNRCGRLIRHDDPAGTRAIVGYSLYGETMAENRRFLTSVEAVEWPQDIAQRDRLLESGDGYATATRFDAVGAVARRIDASGNVTLHGYTLGGTLKETRFSLADGQETRTAVSNTRYSAQGQVERQRLGNDVLIENTYELRTGRLTRILSTGADGRALQDLIYQYDAVGNVLDIQDATQPDRYDDNRITQPVTRFRYDSLYQLIEARGREVSVGASHGPALPDMQHSPVDPKRLANYIQNYAYDPGGNLQQIQHIGAQSFTRNMCIARNSNRSLPQDEAGPDIEKAFDANGNLLQLGRGSTLHWDVRNQLQGVTAVKREEDNDDHERYVYDSHGQRCRKIGYAHAAKRMLTRETRYLPGLELHIRPNGERLQVALISVGRCDVRILHWQEHKPSGIDNDQIRFSLTDHLGSSTLELDQQSRLISQEGYYPFGGTAWWAARSSIEAGYKTVRYSGKERDASGLYYYGSRYYAPWYGRWISADPSGKADGLNLYRFNRNSPLVFTDPDGRAPTANDDASQAPEIGRGLEQITAKNPVFGAAIALAFDYAKQGLNFTRKEINLAKSPFASPQQRADMLRLLRPSSQASTTADPEILKMLSHSFGTLTDFANHYDSDRLVAVGGDRNSKTAAWIETGDPRHHLYLRDSITNESPHRLAWNIIHELSHAANGTKDYWYINTPSATAPGETGLASYAGRVEAFIDLQQDDRRYANHIWDGPDASELQPSQVPDTSINRAKRTLNNADSLALIASVINERSKGPLSRLTTVPPRLP